MDRRDAAQRLTEVLRGHGDEQLKAAAVDGLVALGAFAEPSLAGMLDDPSGGDWARAAMEQIRFVREHPVAAPAADAGDEVDALEGFVDHYGPQGDAADEDADDDAGQAGGPAGPDQDVVDGSYEDFLRRFEQGSGGDATTS
jgi:hypothetical protein